jgi:hypothetical protein
MPSGRCQYYSRRGATVDGRAMDTRIIDAGMDRVAADFRGLLEAATPAELHAPTSGTKWTNRQLLFHMLFGFLLVRGLVVMVKGFGRLPESSGGPGTGS